MLWHVHITAYINACYSLQDFGNISNLQVVPDGMAPATGYPPRGH